MWTGCGFTWFGREHTPRGPDQQRNKNRKNFNWIACQSTDNSGSTHHGNAKY